MTGQKQIGSRQTPWMQVARLTNFYPLYDAANDQVDAVLPVQRLRFQRILPRYQLSTSETRDQGTGPMFDGVSAWRPEQAKPAPSIPSPSKNVVSQRIKDPALGQKVDVFA